MVFEGHARADRTGVDTDGAGFDDEVGQRVVFAGEGFDHVGVVVGALGERCRRRE